jgi:hypothetical protein
MVVGMTRALLAQMFSWWTMMHCQGPKAGYAHRHEHHGSAQKTGPWARENIPIAGAALVVKTTLETPSGIADPPGPMNGGISR